MEAPVGQRIPAFVDGTLVPVDKIDVHRMGLRHPAVSVFVMDGQGVLLQRRALTKYHTPGLWTNSCCTHPHWGEPPADCARRRLGEELGLLIGGLTHSGQVEYRADVGQGMVEHELVDVYLAEAPRSAALNPDPAEVMELRWTDLAALEREIAETPDRFTPWLRLYLSDHRDRIFGA